MCNNRVKDKNLVVNDSTVLESVKQVEKLIDGNGRVLLRQSGTEPVIRIMLEAETEEKCHDYAEIVAKTVEERGFLVE